MAIIFDLDGLMVDTERLYIEVDLILAAKYDRTADHEMIARMMGQKPLDAMEFSENPVKSKYLLLNFSKRGIN
jgi:beta-phosphoglucomutase-like phosphatase (HAD superfamily)